MYGFQTWCFNVGLVSKLNVTRSAIEKGRDHISHRPTTVGVEKLWSWDLKLGITARDGLPLTDWTENLAQHQGMIQKVNKSSIQSPISDIQRTILGILSLRQLASYEVQPAGKLAVSGPIPACRYWPLS
ncbi:hypothetical protein EVAR_44644_1 [Eumeta japonica]|uniref:Uncharacterized protein n=1 Tax=Eumeta variegata TaxID=151549 RepID=A0A4C1XED1_EUMVA|nr:hypothetical protein EVAR_44644_1 [Eumeta japonica]